VLFIGKLPRESRRLQSKLLWSYLFLKCNTVLMLVPHSISGFWLLLVILSDFHACYVSNELKCCKMYACMHDQSESFFGLSIT